MQIRYYLGMSLMALGLLVSSCTKEEPIHRGEERLTSTLNLEATGEIDFGSDDLRALQFGENGRITAQNSSFDTHAFFRTKSGDRIGYALLRWSAQDIGGNIKLSLANGNNLQIQMIKGSGTIDLNSGEWYYSGIIGGKRAGTSISFSHKTLGNSEGRKIEVPLMANWTKYRPGNLAFRFRPKGVVLMAKVHNQTKTKDLPTDLTVYTNHLSADGFFDVATEQLKFNWIPTRNRDISSEHTSFSVSGVNVPRGQAKTYFLWGMPMGRLYWSKAEIIIPNYYKQGTNETDAFSITNIPEDGQIQPLNLYASDKSVYYDISRNFGELAPGNLKQDKQGFGDPKKTDKANNGYFAYPHLQDPGFININNGNTWKVAGSSWYIPSASEMAQYLPYSVDTSDRCLVPKPAYTETRMTREPEFVQFGWFTRPMWLRSTYWAVPQTGGFNIIYAIRFENSSKRAAFKYVPNLTEGYLTVIYSPLASTEKPTIENLKDANWWQRRSPKEIYFPLAGHSAGSLDVIIFNKTHGTMWTTTDSRSAGHWFRYDSVIYFRENMGTGAAGPFGDKWSGRNLRLFKK